MVVALFFLGLLFGSFANVLILRLHSKQKGIFSGRSACPHCQHQLSTKDLVPLFSWLWLRGKCRYCRERISIQYPLVELIMALLWGFVAWQLQITLTATSAEWMLLAFYLFIVSALFVITVYDLKYLEIPDEISLPTIAVLLLTLPLGFTPEWDDALIGAAIPVGFFALQIWISDGKWMGGGDLRLGAIMGLLLGWKVTLLALFLSYFLGAISGLLLIAIGKKELGSQLPFGPFLAIATFIGLFWGSELLSFYLHISGLA